MPRRLNEPRRRRRLVSLAPLIDVVFILLVFFMLATSFLEWRALPLELPAATAAARSDTQAIILEVAPASVRAGGRVRPLAALIAETARAAAAAPDRPVLVRAIGGASLQRVVTVLDRLHAAGVGRVSLIAAPAP